MSTIFFLLVQGGRFQFIMWPDKSKATVSYQRLGQCIWCGLEKTWFCKVNGYHSLFVEFCFVSSVTFNIYSNISSLMIFLSLGNLWHCFYRRLDNNMNIYKGVVQRAQLQLARFQVNILNQIIPRKFCQRHSLSKLIEHFQLKFICSWRLLVCINLNRIWNSW